MNTKVNYDKWSSSEVFKVTEYTLKLPYFQHSLLAKRVFFHPRFCCSVLHHGFCCTGFLVFKHQHCYLISKHQHWSPSINTATWSSSTNTATCSPSIITASGLQVSSLLPGLQVSSLLPGLQVSSLLSGHHCFRCIVLAIVLTFPLNLYVLRSFHRLTSKPEEVTTELVVFQTRCVILARLLLQGHADLHPFSKFTPC